MLLTKILTPTGWFAGGVAHKSRIVTTTQRVEIIFDYLDVPVPKIEE